MIRASRKGYALIVPLTLAVLGCDTELHREYGPWVTEKKTVSCSYACFSCGPKLGMNGDVSVECGMESCSGKRAATVRTRTYHIDWQSERRTMHDQEEILATHGECK